MQMPAVLLGPRIQITRQPASRGVEPSETEGQWVRVSPAFGRMKRVRLAHQNPTRLENRGNSTSNAADRWVAVGGTRQIRS